MKKMFVLAVLVTLFVSGAVPSAYAAGVIYDNGSPNAGYGTQMNANLVAGNFSIGGSGANITNLVFWSDLFEYSPTSVSWAIYSDTPGKPGSVLSNGLASVAGAVTGGYSSNGYPQYLFNLPVAFTLPANSYWLGLQDGSPNPVNPPEMLWSSTASGPPEGMYLDGDWWGTGNALAFQIIGTPNVSRVPDPASSLTLWMGGFAIALFRRFTNKRASKA